MPNNKSKKRQRAAGRRGEIVFDPEARKEYLRGFSERKRQRRAFGLAMQKVKDRKAKLEQRAEEKLAIQEQIEEAEKQKEDLLEGLFEENETSIVHAQLPAEASTGEVEDESFEKVQTYQDVQTQTQWGGEVVVTTSTHIPGDSDDEDGAAAEQQQERKQQSRGGGRKKKGKSTDAEQEYAGNVEKFMHELKGNMPGKKKRDHGHKQKDKYGAANMKGMATGGDFKIAQKALQRSQGKRGKGGKGGQGSGKRKR